MKKIFSLVLIVAMMMSIVAFAKISDETENIELYLYQHDWSENLVVYENDFFKMEMTGQYSFKDDDLKFEVILTNSSGVPLYICTDHECANDWDIGGMIMSVANKKSRDVLWFYKLDEAEVTEMSQLEYIEFDLYGYNSEGGTDDDAHAFGDVFGMGYKGTHKIHIKLIFG